MTSFRVLSCERQAVATRHAVFIDAGDHWPALREHREAS